jgi:hypothetical protein
VFSSSSSINFSSVSVIGAAPAVVVSALLELS